MNNPEYPSKNLDSTPVEGISRSELEITELYSASRSLDQTGDFDSKTHRQSVDVTMAAMQSGQVHASAVISERRVSSSADSLVGTSIGGYRIVSALGSGGMGRVFRADDSSGRPVAIKLLSPTLARSSEALARFKQEGLIASQINHSRCVFVHRVDEDAGTPFIAMELMTGLTLKDLVVQKGALPYADAIKLILQCIEGLIEAHSLGMIHRDIKPANCYLDAGGNVKIGDFGLARSLVGDSELTQTGAFIGTPLFSSPEQLLGQEVDVRSDIYSLTATLYFLLAGQAPFESPHAAQVIARIASSDPPPLSSLEIEVPEELERIVMKGLARDPQKRYQTFLEMQADLLALMAPKPETATLLRRVIAGIADSFLVSMATGLVSITILPVWDVKDSKFLTNITLLLFNFLYFFTTEALFATSLGKAALRIRIVDAAHGRRPRLWKFFLRSGAYVSLGIFIELLFFLAMQLADWNRMGVLQGLAELSTSLLAILAIYSAWFFTGKRQLLHDWISGTECVISVPAVVQSTQLNLPDYAPPGIYGEHKLPSKLGRFQVNHEIAVPGADSSVRWLDADDPQLERSVWIALSNSADIDYEQQQCSKDLSTRLRFIEQGAQDGQRWYAYVAPEGIPLQECLVRGVHFPWHVTSFIFRQMLTHFHAICQGDKRIPLAKLAEWWVDRNGRLSIASLDSNINAVTSDTDAAQLQAGNSATYKQLLETVSLLALPKNHRLRRAMCKSKLDSSQYCMLAREALPPLRSLRFCESIAAGKYLPSVKTLESELHRLSRGGHFITSKARFFNAAVSMAFCIPVLAVIAILTVTPVFLQFMELRRNVQLLSTLETIVQHEDPNPQWWDGATEEQRNYWLSEPGRRTLGQQKEESQQLLADFFAGMGKIEQAVLTNISVPDSITNPSICQLAPKPQPADGQDQQLPVANGQSVEIRPSDIKLNLSNDRFSLDQFLPERWSERHLLSALELANTKSSPKILRDGIEWRLGVISLSLLGALAFWTAITFGGLTNRFTGVCLVARNGNRLGLLRSCWRSIVLFSPVAMLLYLLATWPIISLDDLWWTTLLKSVLLFSPLVYLASTLIWTNRTLADVFSGTTAIPR